MVSQIYILFDTSFPGSENKVWYLKYSCYCRKPKERDVLKELGIPDENIIDYHDGELIQKILRANNGNFYDHVVDLVDGRI